MDRDAKWLAALRKTLGLKQEEMAEKIGLTVHPYRNAERGHSELRLLHINSAERVSLAEAVAQRNPMLTTPEIRREALELARMITGE